LKKATVDCPEVLPRHSIEGAEENHENLQ